MILRVMEGCSFQWSRIGVVTAGPVSCWHVLTAFVHKSFGTLTAAHCELPGLSFFMGHTGSVDTVNATQPWHIREEGPWLVDRINMPSSWSLLWCQAVVSGHHGEVRPETWQGGKGGKRHKPIHILISAPWESSLYQHVLRTLLLHHGHSHAWMWV